MWPGILCWGFLTFEALFLLKERKKKNKKKKKQKKQELKFHPETKFYKKFFGPNVQIVWELALALSI